MADKQGQERPVPATPGELTRLGTLPVGVDYGGGPHNDFIIGPVTVDVEAQAEATMPDWIDPALLHKLYCATAKDDLLKELDLKRQTMTPAEMRKAAVMSDARYSHILRYRVERLGGIPADDIPASVGKLLTEDMEYLIKAAQEVDAAAEKFCKKARAALDATSNAGVKSEGPGDGVAGI